MSEAFRAWKAATRFLFWTLVEAVTLAVRLRKIAERELAVLNPNNPTDLWALGYAIFYYDMIQDAWTGAWHAAGAKKGFVVEPDFMVYKWDGVPWHRVRFEELKYDEREFRAVELSYAQKHLKRIV